ncbi:MAG: response regulator [Clostridia bacterium]|nr:response regulator [Clostridia bacterium]
MRVLVVDDAMFMRNVLKGILKDSEFEVVGEAANGVEALEKVKELNPDIVTLDITMPEMDGLTALNKIIEIDDSIKIVMVSAMGQQNMVVDAIRKGAKDFIVKPFDETRVFEAFNKLK